MTGDLSYCVLYSGRGVSVNLIYPANPEMQCKLCLPHAPTRSCHS